MVIHKDLKGANILVAADGTVKLADFGCSTSIEKTLTSLNGDKKNPLIGSVPWMAPEVVSETGYGRRSDIWSFGCTILEMATGKIPWSHYNFENPVALLMKIALSDEIPQIPDNISDELKDFIKQCLQRDPTLRPHAKDLMNHPFLKDIKE
jgi:Serine/threonine protein kinase